MEETGTFKLVLIPCDGNFRINTESFDITSHITTTSRPHVTRHCPARMAAFYFALALISAGLLVSSFNSSPYLKRSPPHKCITHQLALHATIDGSTSNDATTRERAKLGRVPIISRTIHIDIDDPAILGDGKEQNKSLDVTVWEMASPSEMIQNWWSVDQSERTSGIGDPFGVVMWPGSIVASKMLMKQHFTNLQSPVANATVLILGAGTGVEAQTAALLGARRVIATDINQLTLGLLEYGVKRMGEVIDKPMNAVVEAKCKM